MTEFNMKIGVDASQGRRELDSFRASVDSTKRSLSSLAASNTGGGFAQLARQLSDASSGFERLQRAASGNGFRGVAQSIASLSSARSATNDLRGLAGSFDLVGGAVKSLAAAFAGLSIANIASAVQDAGQRITSLKIAIDSVAESPREAADSLKFLNDLATRTGGSLGTMQDSYRSLGTSMRALALDTKTINDTFTGLQLAFSAMHTSTRDQALAMRMFSESFSQGSLHMRVVNSLATHLPTVLADLERATGKTGEQLRKQFAKGGIPAEEVMPKLAQIWTERYGPQMSAALEHSTAQLNLFDTALERLKQRTYESGFDQGLTSFLKSITGAKDAAAAIDSFGDTLGRAFQTGFATLTVLTKTLWSAREPLLAVAGTGAAIVGLGSAFKIASLGAGLLFSRVGLLATAIVMLVEKWDDLKSALSGSDANFNTGASYLWGATKGAADFLLNGKAPISFSNILDAADKSGTAEAFQTWSAQQGKASGKNYADTFAKESKSTLTRLMETFGLGGLSESFDRATKEWRDLSNAPTPAISGHGAYEETKKAHDEMRRLREITMKEDAVKLFDKLNPAAKAAHELADELTKIQGMLNKQGPDGKFVNAADVSRMKEVARMNAFDNFAPAAAKIKGMADNVRLGFANAGDKDALETEKGLLQLRNELKKKGLDLTREEEAAYRSLTAAERELAKGGENGFTQWANNMKSASDALNDNIKSSMDSIAGGITNIVTNGRGQFKSLGQAIRAEFANIAKQIAGKFIKSGIEGMMSDAIKGIAGNGGFSANIQRALGLGQGVLDKANKGLDAALKTTGEMNVTAAVVNVNGGVAGTGLNPIGASGRDAFGLNGVNVSALGGSADGAFKSIGTNSIDMFRQRVFGGNATQMLAGINKLAAERGLNPRDLAAVMSYETGGTFDPNKIGGKGNNYAGLIQLGPNERKQFGWQPGQSLDQQFGAINGYLKARGGSNTDLAGLYRTINGGNVNASLNASDGNGTIAQHIERIRQQHGGAYDLLTRKAGLDSDPTGAITKLSSATEQVSPNVNTFTDAITKTGTSAVNAESGLGGLIGKLGSLAGGLFGGGGGIGAVAGAFSEGGLSTSPVSGHAMPASFWNGAPQYAEGTPNTSGGIPAVLHDNEAVVPLSRGREIPVRLEGGSQGSGSMTTVKQVVNLHAKDADSFRRNSGQIGSDMMQHIGRALARNA